MHGKGNLDKAINLLDQDDKKDFSEFVNSEVSLILIICSFVDRKKF